jgi:N-acetylglutamate synthase-like GNAT family acetyltransferase
MFKIRIAHTPEETERIIELRYKILRKPWNQSAETATDNIETISINAYIENEKKEVVACGRLQENPNKVGQIRFMAVDDNQQGKGLGKMIVSALESEAKKLQLSSIELQARENAVEFYKSCGYTVKEKTFLLWGLIQHYLMEKVL